MMIRSRSPARAAAGAVALAALALVSACASATSGQPQAGPGSPQATAPAAAPKRTAVPPPIATHRATPAPNPCAGNTAAQLVHVSIAHQHAWLCARTHLALSTAVTTGMDGQYTETPTGTYRIQTPSTDTTLTLLDGETYAVKYWVPFDAPLYGFHDSSWQTFPYGSARYHVDGSHGCIHMPLAAMQFLYRWAAVGATVRIDP